MINIKGMIKEVKDYAMAHYTSGWDVIVECWSDNDIENVINQEIADGATTPLEIIQAFADIAGIYFDREMDAINSAF